MRGGFPWSLAILALACGETPTPRTDLHLGTELEGRVELAAQVQGSLAIDLRLDGVARVVEAAVTGPGAARAYLRPRPLTGDTAIVVRGEGPAQVVVWSRGAPPPAARRERSLVWTDPALLDDPAVIGLGRLFATVADDGHGGRLFDAWLRRFASTAHSERALPAQLADAVARAQGDDPSRWDLDRLGFVVTGVHNRIDLAERDGGCGQLRVSLSSTDPALSPFHVIFLFRQEPRDDDRAPDGGLHCLGTARRWARLAALDGAGWLAAAFAVLDEALVRERFLMIETVELSVSPWEWRQWRPGLGPEPLDNPPLFETVDVERLNVPGPLRADFLAFVAGNAAALDARTLEIPERFRGPSARVPPATRRPPLDLSGLDPAIAGRLPRLLAHLEIVGCPACHSDDAPFVQTSTQRTFSPFYDKELTARAARLDLMVSGAPVPVPPFGPLQAVP